MKATQLCLKGRLACGVEVVSGKCVLPCVLLCVLQSSTLLRADDALITSTLSDFNSIIL